MITAKRIIVELLSATDPAQLTLEQLFNGADVFGLTRNNVRVTLTRLRSAGIVDSSERGHYGLGDQALAINRYVTHWRQRLDQLQGWDGTWLALQTAAVPRANRVTWKQIDDFCRFNGFAAATEDLYLRPNNIAGLAELASGFAAAISEGLLVVLEVTHVVNLDLDPDRLWQTTDRQSRYEAHLQRMHDCPTTGDSEHVATVARETYLVGSDVIREIVLDPMLPAELVPTADRDRMIETMKSFDAAGRRLWRQVMAAEPEPGLGNAA